MAQKQGTLLLEFVDGRVSSLNLKDKANKDTPAELKLVGFVANISSSHAAVLLEVYNSSKDIVVRTELKVVGITIEVEPSNDSLAALQKAVSVA